MRSSICGVGCVVCPLSVEMCGEEEKKEEGGGEEEEDGGEEKGE